MKKSKYIAILVFALSIVQMEAQQVGMYNHYFFKPLIYNPAFAGSGGDVEAMLLSRSQWTGFNGAPQLNVLTIDGAIKEKKVGLGLILTNERRGIMQRNGGIVAYSYRLNFNEETSLLLGIGAGVVNQSIDFSKAVAENYTDPTLFGGMQQKTSFDGNAGLAFIWKGLQLAASAPQLFANRFNYVDNSGTRTWYAQVRHYTASAGYKLELVKDKGISVTPQFLARIVPGAPTQFDGILNFAWENKFWVGGVYHSNYALGINAGISIHKKLSIGYSYEVITADIGKYAGISHEILVNFKFGGKKKEVNEDSVKIEEEQRLAKEAAYEQKIDSLQEALEQNRDRIKDLNKQLGAQAQQQQQTQSQVQVLEEKIKNIQEQVNNVPVNPTSGGQTVNSIQQPSNNNAVANKQNGSNQNDHRSIKKASENKISEPASNKNSEVNKANDAVNPNNTTTNRNSALEMLDSKVLESDVWIASYPSSEYTNDKDQHPQPAYYIIVGTFFYRDFAEAETERFRKKGYKGCNWIYSEITKHNYIFTHKIALRQEAISKVKEMQQTAVKDAWILQLK
jgi:type IX secretion system PorP/SprF family membrane protein